MGRDYQAGGVSAGEQGGSRRDRPPIRLILSYPIRQPISTGFPDFERMIGGLATKGTGCGGTIGQGVPFDFIGFRLRSGTRSTFSHVGPLPIQPKASRTLAPAPPPRIPAAAARRLAPRGGPRSELASSRMIGPMAVYTALQASATTDRCWRRSVQTRFDVACRAHGSP